MKSSTITLNDLPDEMLMMIFRKLSNFDALYSLYGVNQRFTRILRDPIFVKHLIIGSTTEMLNRICSEVLPSIAERIHRFDLETSSIEQIFKSAQYPNLSTLGLKNINENSVEEFFTEKRCSLEIFKRQIRTLHLIDDTKDDDTFDFPHPMFDSIYQNVFSVFPNLLNLQLGRPLDENACLLSFVKYGIDTFYSSNLVKLIINIDHFDDSLYLFDGRFSQLQSVDLFISSIYPFVSVPNKILLPKMKEFSIHCKHFTQNFEGTILPLLSRMINLEKLHLSLKIYVTPDYIDEKYLQTNLLSLLPRLRTSSFLIHSIRFLHEYPMNYSIDHRGKTRYNRSEKNYFYSYEDYFEESKEAHHHVYSSPCFTEYCNGISNRFPGGRFPHVRKITLYDEEPFEHEFFLRIEEIFPSMKKLRIRNSKRQKHQSVSLIKYHRLDTLHLVDVHDDYVKQFLLSTKASFHCQLTFFVAYESLQRVTNMFTCDQMRINASIIFNLCLIGEFESSQSLQEYIPHSKISSVEE